MAARDLDVSQFDSFIQHDQEYDSEGKIELERECHKKFTEEKLHYKSDNPLGKCLDMFPQLKVAVDIGAGTGWVTKLLYDKQYKVYSIEPSRAAKKICQILYPKMFESNKIDWRTYHAEEILEYLELTEPTLFNASCVLSHLEDESVECICKLINKKALVGSVLSFSECFGNIEYHNFNNLWHVRKQEWWQKQFPNWKFDFFGGQVQAEGWPNKGFLAVKQE